MIKHAAFYIILAMIFSVPQAMAKDSAGLSFSLSPTTIVQGDPFIVRVHGAAEVPSGQAFGRELAFVPCATGKGCYEALGSATIEDSAGSHVIVVSSGERKASARMRVMAGKWKTISLTLPPGKVDLSEEDELRADMEEVRLKAIWAIKSERLWSGRFVAPLDTEVSTGFGVRRDMNKGMKISVHKGVDMRGTMGLPVRAANSGRVVLTDELYFGGNTLVIDHGAGVYTVYMHLSEFKSKVGDMVSKGDVVALVGSTGRSTGPHLHYTVKVAGESVNPEAMPKLDLK